MNGQSKLECYTTIGLKSLPGTKSLPYWVHSYVTNTAPDGQIAPTPNAGKSY